MRRPASPIDSRLTGKLNVSGGRSTRMQGCGAVLQSCFGKTQIRYPVNKTPNPSSHDHLASYRRRWGVPTSFASVSMLGRMGVQQQKQEQEQKQKQKQ